MVITAEGMQVQADKTVNVYAQLEAQIFKRIIETLKHVDIEQYDEKTIVEWQLRQLNNIGALSKEVISDVQKVNPAIKQQIDRLIRDNGWQIKDEIDEQLQDMLHKPAPISSESGQIINAVIDKTFLDLDNSVNQTLLTTNIRNNTALKTYQNIVKQTTLAVQLGNKTPQQALKETIYKWVDKGLPTQLIDKGGHSWSLETYANTVVSNSAHRVFNELRTNRMQEFGMGVALMSSHPAAREACAYIQGKPVNIVPPGSEKYDRRYDSIYNHGYGKASGTQGINCHHTLTPFDPDTMTNHYQQFDPKEAIENGKVQAKQRSIERAIRASKKRMNAAEALGDNEGYDKYRMQRNAQQAKMREFLKENDWLKRNRDREQIYSGMRPNRKNLKNSSADRNYVQQKIHSGEYSVRINSEKQGPHMEKTRMPGKSYFKDGTDVDELIYRYAGTGEVRTSKSGNYMNVEVIKDVGDVHGVDVMRDGTERKANGITIHYSKKRTHVVPRYDD
ncbi:capsid protein [Weissella viridescens]|uniref:Capsid protein n=1 Tax=Weissella viridescens TaxID=1629 RepID=A0A3P2RC75_WEIVI|nr:phage minor capsid protein [Weissella viridescens]RRG18257.1 capsid protein [Weissella viridescens]